MRVSDVCEVSFVQMFSTRSVLSAHKRYLHSDGTFFGHSLVHPDEGHVVVKVINRALKRNITGLKASTTGETGFQTWQLQQRTTFH